MSCSFLLGPGPRFGSRCFHRHAVWMKAKPLVREEKSPTKRQRNSVGSSSEHEQKPRKKHSTKYNFKLASKKSNKTVDKEPEKVDIRLKRRTRVEIDEVAAEKMVLYKDSELCLYLLLLL